MKKVIKLTESDINRIVRKVLNEDVPTQDPRNKIMTCLGGKNVPESCKTFIDKVLKTGELDLISGMSCANSAKELVTISPLPPFIGGPLVDCLKKNLPEMNAKLAQK